MKKMIIPYKESTYTVNELSKISNKPGIYHMIDENGIIMYIGKSKTLRSRVRSYFSKEHENEKLNRMVMFVAQIKIYQTETHLDAMLLEVERIKEERPLYNSQFKKSDNYSYLDFESKEVVSIRNMKSDGRQLGPFRNSEYLMHFKSFVEKVVPIKKDLEYNIIPKRLTEKERKKAKQFVYDVLTKESKLSELLVQLNSMMIEFASNMSYENANFIKFTITVIEYLSRTTLASKECLYYDYIDEGIKVYKICDYTVMGVNYVNSIEDITREFETFDLNISEKDILDHQLVVYHELRKNPSRIKKIDR